MMQISVFPLIAVHFEGNIEKYFIIRHRCCMGPCIGSNNAVCFFLLNSQSYIYYDEMVFTGVVGTLRTLYASRKYCFYELARACVNYLENNVSIEHVLKLLKASFDFNEPRLRSLCMRLIINDTFEVLKRPEFMNVHRDLIVQILQQDVLNIREIELFDQVMHWAENECERIGIPVTAMNQRIALGNHNFANIRFPTILPHEFATHVVESGALKTDEIISILQYHITGGLHYRFFCTAYSPTFRYVSAASNTFLM